MRTYLDHNATSPLRPTVKAAMIAAMETCGNPSSVHREGRVARKVMDDAREQLAMALGCLPQMIAFTGSGTEANNMAIRGLGAEKIVISAIEHPSVMAAAKATGKPVETVAVDGQGRIDLDTLATAARGANVLVSVMAANNETGVVEPVADVIRIAKAAGAMVHVDATQAFKKMPVNFGLLGCDLMTIAAHKAGGPVGVGALVIRDGLVVEPLLSGGGQELRRRAGTENLPAIAGFGALAREPQLDVYTLTEAVVAGLDGGVIFSDRVERLQNTICFAAPGFLAETLLINFDLEGISVSSGSACSSGKVGRSHVLEAMGVTPDLAASAIRLSLGWNTTQADIDAFLRVWAKIKHQRKAA